jgi:hypothetical protein
VLAAPAAEVGQIPVGEIVSRSAPFGYDYLLPYAVGLPVINNAVKEGRIGFGIEREVISTWVVLRVGLRATDFKLDVLEHVVEVGATAGGAV